MTEIVSLAERLRERRATLGISQSQAARELDVARTAYRLWEMEAARPAPDRWRLIARWLGISVSTLLMAEELMTQNEAGTTGAIAADLDGGVALAIAEEPDARIDFFREARDLLAAAIGAGDLTDEAGEQMHEVLDRIEEDRGAPPTMPWEATEMFRDLPADERAPSVARSGLRFVAAGIPEELLDTAERLAGALVERSVVAAGSVEAGRIGVSIQVGRDRLRVEVLDAPGSTRDGAGPADPLAQEGPDLEGTADRWGGGSERGRRIAWFELDLPVPGDVVARTSP